jgi:hypothetical protein
MALTGRQLRDRDGGLNMNTILDGITSEKPFYDDARPALCAIIWGFCREGRLVPVDEDGNTLENSVVLDQEHLSTTRLKLLPREPIGKLLEEGGFKQTTETVADGLINLQESNQQLRSSLIGLQEDVQLVVDTDIHSDAVAGLLKALIEELEDRVTATTDRLSVVKSQGDGLGDAIEQTNDVQKWFDEVKDVWNRRLESLYRFDAQLTVGDDRFEWVDDDALSAVTGQRNVLENFDGSWWTTDGWKALVAETTTGLNNEFQRSWNTYIDRQGLTDLVERIDSNPWVIPATELPAGVQPTMEREYIKPLREVQRWYETIDQVVASLASDDEDTLISTADDISDTDPLSTATDYDVDELASRLTRLTAIVGNRTPDEVDQIGMLPDDRESIDRHLERLVESRELGIDVTDSGVVIR